jgi:uncharacterized protein (TIGR03437 family)
MERIEAGSLLRAVRTADNPVAGNAAFAFSRSVAVLANRQKIVLLTRSGFTVLPWTYDAAAIPPRISHIGNAADGQPRLAPGSLVSLFGSNLSPINAATSEMPIPAALGESCLTVNGFLAPMFFVSPSQINAQIPYAVDGQVSIVLRTPGGVSDTFRMTLRPAAPGVFQVPIPETALTTAAVYNGRNGGLATGSNPVKRGDRIAIFLTGLGRTSPQVEAGAPAPADPPAESLIVPEVRLGGHSLPVYFSGLTPGGAGVYQIQAEVVRSVPTGMAVPLEIAAAGAEVSVAVRVIE